MSAYTPIDAPLISIAMCTYNGELYLREQIDSLIEQDYPNLEIEIVDDCSTDLTVKIVKEYAEKYSHIHLHFNEHRLGFRDNFCRALLLCSGEYISLCDQDDIWFPHKISSLYNVIGDHSLACSEVQLIDQDGNELDKEFPSDNMLEGKCHMSLLFGNFVTGHTCLIRRDILEKSIPIPAGVEMHDHWLAFVAAATGGIKVLREKLSLYRQHDNNAVQGQKKKKKPSKLKRRVAKYKYLNSFVNAASQLNWLPEVDLRLIGEVKAALSNYPTWYHNRTLKKILRENADILLASKKKQKRIIRSLSRGYLGRFF